MAPWSVTVLPCAPGSSYGRKKLKHMSTKNPKSTTRLMKNRRFSTTAIESVPPSTNATSYGVQMAVYSKRTPTSASHDVMKLERGFRSRGFFVPTLTGKPSISRSSSSTVSAVAAPRLFAHAGRRERNMPLPTPRDANAGLSGSGSSGRRASRFTPATYAAPFSSDGGEAEPSIASGATNAVEDESEAAAPRGDVSFVL